MQFDYDRLDAKNQQHIYTSKEAADGRLRRRRRRLWLQLTARPRPARWWRPRSRCPASLPASAHAQSMPDEGIFEFKYLDYRDWQPGRRPHDGATRRRSTR